MAAEPDIASDGDPLHRPLLGAYECSRLNAMIMVNEPASRADQRGIANRDALADIEFTSGADENLVANLDTGMITPNSIVFENNPVLDVASFSQ